MSKIIIEAENKQKLRALHRFLKQSGIPFQPFLEEDYLDWKLTQIMKNETYGQKYASETEVLNKLVL